MPLCPASEDCSLIVDVVLISSDGTLLGAHSRNLEIFTVDFPAPKSTLQPDGERVLKEMSETAEVLQLLLHFTHNLPPPDLSSQSFEILLDLGKAAHKYGMSYAIQFANNEINTRIAAHPLEILAYKLEMSDFDRIDDAARRTMIMPVKQVIVAIGVVYFHKWALYREAWQKTYPPFRKKLQELITKGEGDRIPSLESWTLEQLRVHPSTNLSETSSGSRRSGYGRLFSNQSGCH